MKKKICCIYRISDGGNPDKIKVKDFNKIDSLNNFIEVFSDARVVVFADNCSDDLLEKLSEYHFEVMQETKLGNAKSWRFAASWAMNNLEEDDIVYFVEDDYYHLQGSSESIYIALKHSDYYSLYDHPDKYNLSQNGKNINLNPYVKRYSEPTQVYHSEKFIFRTTSSTTMTFACYVKTLRQDMNVWNFATSFGKIPNDFLAFQILSKSRLNASFYRHIPYQVFFYILRFFVKRRMIFCPLPSLSSHLEIDYLPHNFKIIK